MRRSEQNTYVDANTGSTATPAGTSLPQINLG